MNQQRALIVLVLVAFGFLLLAFFYTRDAKRAVSPIDGPVIGPSSNGKPVVLITQKTYQNGTHSWRGSVSLPTPCHSLEKPEVAVAESYPEQVRVSLISKASDGICAQVVTEKTFTVDFQASQNASVSFTLNGEPSSVVFDENSNVNYESFPEKEKEKPSLIQ